MTPQCSSTHSMPVTSAQPPRNLSEIVTQPSHVRPTRISQMPNSNELIVMMIPLLISYG